MQRDEIIEMARQFGLSIGVALDGSKSMGKRENKSFAVGRLSLEDFVAFVQLVAAKEREACAKTVENMAGYKGGVNDDGQAWMVRTTKYDCAKAIRARGEA